MINVNWSKIKPYEKKPFAISVMIIECVIFSAFLLIGFVNHTQCVILKDFTALFFMILVAHFVHIESRMLQIYMLLGILDVSMIFAAFLPLPKGFVTAVFTIFLILVFATAIATIVTRKIVTDDTMYNCSEPDRGNVFAGKNVMMFAPHEDDEINLYGGIIEQYVKNGSAVRIVFLTNGDCYGIGKIRIKEALNVADDYGIPRENIIFLGYSDSLLNDEGLHIYNCPDSELVTSIKGYTETYGIENHPSYTRNEFTRENIINDFKSVILNYKPDTIFCCDYDSHLDHRAIGLFCEEALDDILKSDSCYTPEVFKGFAYSMAWIGKLDYYSENACSTHQHKPAPYMSETNVYKWTDRVRFPVAKESLSRVMQNASSYKAMMKYSSQTATDHANGILNCDKVFWHRRTDSLLYNAKIKATSGDASKLTQFKLVDSENINSGDELPVSNAWVADDFDNNRIVVIKLNEKKLVSSLSIYDSPVPDNHITNATVKLGNVQFETGELKENGSATDFDFNPVETDVIAIRIDEFIGKCSLLKVEAFEKTECSNPQFIKLVNSNDDFCYDYMIDESGVEAFNVYTYPVTESADYDLNTTGGIDARLSDGKIIVNCPEGAHGKLTVALKNNPFIYDIITFSNPDEKKRALIKHKQELEQKLWSFPMQWDYYWGLIKRLAIYK
ncbi:MAG: PIG-L family deacetylase [Eubacterium sp.]